jgi:signal transduction histidine kinase
MRLVQKLSLALVLTTSAVIAVGGALRAQREVAVLDFDRVRDHHVMGRALGAAIAAVWHDGGEARALAALEQANVPEGRVHAKWVWLEGGPPDAHTAFDQALVDATAAGETITRVVPSAAAGADPMRYTYVPLAVDKHRRGALELSESLAGQRRFTHRVVTETVLTTLVLALVSAGVATWLGIWIVGRPIEALAAKARRVGQGDFAEPLQLPQKDELGELAREMNTMCVRLVELQERVAVETAQKLAATDQLRHADRLNTVGKLASGIAHELGTPLNVVGARAESLASGEATAAEVRDYGAVIVDATEKMTRIIRQLLDFARRKPSTRRTVAALAPLARRTLALLGPLAQKRDVTLTLEADDAREVLVAADASALEQALTNLVMNAVQSMQRPGTVRVAVREEERAPPGKDARVACAAIAVVDEGAGIRADDIPHVFEPFFTTKDVGEGTGLGLSVAHGIVEDHGGWIDVESVVGAGSTFVVCLPLGGSGDSARLALGLASEAGGTSGPR